MACLRTLRRWMQETAYVARMTCRDGGGDPCYGEPELIKCRYEQQSREVRRPNGDALQSKHVIYTEQPVTITDMVWLPGEEPGDESTGHIILDVSRVPSCDGSVELYEVLL